MEILIAALVLIPIIFAIVRVMRGGLLFRYTLTANR
jgi:hypothetical protein